MKTHIGVQVEKELFERFRRCYPSHGMVSIIMRRLIEELVEVAERGDSINIKECAQKTISKARKEGIIR